VLLWTQKKYVTPNTTPRISGKEKFYDPALIEEEEVKKDAFNDN